MEDVNWVIYNINNKIEVSDINVLVHNYFNSRNIDIRLGGEVTIYDWELAVTGSPLRDLVELPSFVITDDWSNEQILEMVASHKSRLEKATGRVFEEDKWSNELRQSLIQFIAGRASFYLLGESMLNYGFSQRIFKSAMRMIKMHR